MKRACAMPSADTLRATRPERGFTLLELMIVIVIISILMVVTVPSMASFLHANQVSGDASAFYDAVRFAKAQAVESGHAVDLCPLTVGSLGNCSSVPATATIVPNWGGGFQVQDEVTHAVYRTWPAFHAVTAVTTQAVTANQPVPLGTMSNILFNPDQTSVLTSATAGTANIGGSFVSYMKLCDGSSSSSSGRSVVLNGAGFASYNLTNSTSGSSPAYYLPCACSSSTACQ